MGVPTTVWFAELDGNIVVFYRPCHRQGQAYPQQSACRIDRVERARQGAWTDPLRGMARLLDAAEGRRAEQAINRKYPSKRILDLLGRILRRNGSVVMLEIRPIAE